MSAVTADGEKWALSNYGDFVTLAAPGTAQLPVGYNGPPGSYAGTSIAAAYVASAVAGYFVKNPEATRAEATQALLRAVSDDSERGFDPYYGHGVLDASTIGHLLR